MRSALLPLHAAGLALALSGCGTFDTRSGPAPTPTTKPAAPATKSGGYYLDDGPGDNIPDNLAGIPDATPRYEPPHRAANRPYQALGKRYEPMTDARGFRQLGGASWYGKRYHGKPTSSGEPYDMYAMTAAHPTLPIPSYARVTNPENGRSVVVRVNDRGPFHAGRVIDLSYTAAWKLDLLKGVNTVVVDALMPGDPVPATAAAPAPEPQTPPSPPVAVAPPAPVPSAPAPAESVKATTGPGVFLQLGAFSKAENAASFAKDVQQRITQPLPTMHYILSGSVYKLQTGPFNNAEHADNVASLLNQAGFKSFKLVR